MNNFIELLSMYRFSLPAATIMAVALAYIGAQWTARGKSTQIFVLSQGASLGIIIGLVVNIFLDQDFHFLNLALGLGFGGFTLWVCDKLSSTRSDRSHLYLSLFVFYISLSYLLTSLTPALESHRVSAYLGDLAVMSDFSAAVSFLVGLISAIFLISKFKEISRRSFQYANRGLLKSSSGQKLFDVGTLVVTSLAIHSMGFLFTIGSLFIATSFAAPKSRSLQEYQIFLIVISGLGALLGFLISLFSTVLPTVPCIIMAQLALGILIYVKK